jgi:hypothetical protein
MVELKTLSHEAIPRSLDKAEHYRLLGEPSEAESICLDVLQIDPQNQRALITLLLALTDQFETRLASSLRPAQEVLPRLSGEYERVYYGGIICERHAKARLHRGGPGAEFAAYDLLCQAMTDFEKAEAMAVPGNDDAALRYNTCARLLNSNPKIRPSPEERVELPLE